MSRTFKGRAVLPGRTGGEAIVTRTGFNTLASFAKALFARALFGKARRAICSDHGNPDLFGKSLTDKILCIPHATGSTGGGLVLETMIHAGLAPRALLLSGSLDTVTASGVVLSDVWSNKRLVTVDRLGDAFLEHAMTGQRIEIHEDGTVIVG